MVRQRHSLVLVVMCLVLVSTLLLAACGQPAAAPAAPAKDQPIVWRYTYLSVPGAPVQAIFHDGLAERLEKAAGGRLKVIKMADSVKGSEALQGLKNGWFEMASWSTPYYASSYPWLNISFAPGLWTSVTQKDKVSRDTGWMDFMNDFTVKNYDAYTWEMGYTSPQMIYAKKPLLTLDDFNGLKIRTTGYFQPIVLEAMKAKPVAVAWEEVFMSMQTKVVDAAVTGTVGLGISLDKVSSDITYWPNWTMMGEYALSINKSAWDKLPEDLKPILKKTMREAAAEEIVGAEKEWSDFQGIAAGKGLKFHVVKNEAELKKAEPHYVRALETWVNDLKGKGFTFPTGMANYLKEKGVKLQ